MNRCDVCSNDSIMVTQQRACAVIKNKISNCMSYSDVTTCESCMNGYYLTNNTC